jgi:hypothetical protein
MTTAALALHRAASRAPQRWGRMAMASYFVVSATLTAAAHAASWAALRAGTAGPLDGLVAMQVVAEALSAVLFALGRFTGVIARAWVAYCLLRIAAGAPWEGGADAIAALGPWVMGQLAVVGSLLMYLGHREGESS